MSRSATCAMGDRAVDGNETPGSGPALRPQDSRGAAFAPVAHSALAVALLEVPFPWIDPVAINLPGPIDVRWYGLMYMLGFAIAFRVLRSLARDGFLLLNARAVGDLIVAMVLGVMLGATECPS